MQDYYGDGCKAATQYNVILNNFKELLSIGASSPQNPPPYLERLDLTPIQSHNVCLSKT